MVLGEIYFRHGLCPGMTRKQQALHNIVCRRNEQGSDLPQTTLLVVLLPAQTYCFSELGVAGLRLRSTATASRRTGFVTSRAAAS